MRKNLLPAAALLLLTAGMTEAATYKIDPAHSAVTFSVRHMMISTVRGSFGDFEGSFTYVKDQPST